MSEFDYNFEEMVYFDREEVETDKTESDEN